MWRQLRFKAMFVIALGWMALASPRPAHAAGAFFGNWICLGTGEDCPDQLTRNVRCINEYGGLGACYSYCEIPPLTCFEGDPAWQCC